MKFLFDSRPSVMGILNVTPDSFSDGGRFTERDAALHHAEQMVRDGADIIDIGGESTRPGAAPVSVEQELGRVLPALEAIKSRIDVPISIDTSTPEVMSAASEIGVDLINDVRALSKPGAIDIAKASGLSVCLMHMQGDPTTMQDKPHYDSVIDEVRAFFVERLSACAAAGIEKHRILLDPGFGFGKTPDHNLELVNGLRRFADLGLPMLVGLSRKSTITKIVGTDESALLNGSLAGAIWAYHRGAKVIRVHDVLETAQALKMAVSLNLANG